MSEGVRTHTNLSQIKRDLGHPTTPRKETCKGQKHSFLISARAPREFLGSHERIGGGRRKKRDIRHGRKGRMGGGVGGGSHL